MYAIIPNPRAGYFVLQVYLIGSPLTKRIIPYFYCTFREKGIKISTASPARILEKIGQGIVH